MNTNVKRALESMHDQPLNRKQVRTMLHRKCPCRSGKLYKNCCLEDDIRRLVKKQAEMIKKDKTERISVEKGYAKKGMIKVTKMKEESNAGRRKGKKAAH